ncbi:MAG: amino acid permease [Endomicrobium sp.]|jgi:L-asparagine transporter-like permease|nr:amino acid permease [Endomicrobium sp.]
MQEPQPSALKRKLKNRHIQFIALGGAVGTGLFLGTGSAIFSAGPAVILGYLIAGILVFSIMRQLGEMDTQEPMAGSFGYFAYKYWGTFPGFLAGWNYWILYVMVGISELTAIAAYMQYWFPSLPTWQSALLFFALINAVNMTAVRAYGEMEFSFSIIKIAAICAMIITGLYILILQPSLVDGATFKNLWQAASIGKHLGDVSYSGFLPYGIMGLIAAIPIITFAFGGLELVGIAAAETDQPQKTIPKAVNQVIFRILVFYIGTLTVLLSLYHWSNLAPTDSPFVMIFDKIGFKYAAWALNFIILTAALSVYNSCVYSNSRMLYGLSLQQNAPQIFTKTNARGIPFASLWFSGALTFLVVPLNYFIPNWFDAFQISMSFVVACLVINWALIALTHIKFKKQKIKENVKTLFPSPFYPFSNYLTLIFIAFILAAMCLPRLGMAKQVIAVPIWIFAVYICYLISEKVKVSKKTLRSKTRP